MGELNNLMNSASGEKTKWDKFNDMARVYLDGLVKRGLFLKVVERNYVPGRMNYFWVFVGDYLKPNAELERETGREFYALMPEAGITVDDMLYDNQMGISFTDEKRFERQEKDVKSWVDIVYAK